MRTIPLIMLAMAGLGTPPAAAADPAAPGTGDNKRVCRSEATTGSKLRTSECHTRAEWVEIDAIRRKQAEQFQRGMNNPSADMAVGTSAYPR